MPPETKTISLPKTRGKESRKWLEAQGLVSHVPAIRSSDYESVLHCPFQYYLSRRLRLVKALRWSKALSRGSWFHKRLEFYLDPPLRAMEKMECELLMRQDELTEICKSMGIIGGSKDKILERERMDMFSACAWFDAMCKFKIPHRGSVLDYLTRDHWKLLGTEVTAEYILKDKTLSGGKARMLAQFDLLMYHKEQNSLWIVDAKTCSESPQVRLATCPIEFQCQHYMMILKNLIEEGIPQKVYRLPEDVSLGGMIHIGVQKPSIQMGMNDRDYEEYEHTLTRGPRKGQVELRRQYFGEPRFENYVDRCQRWYLAVGEYETKKPERDSDPPINISTTYGSCTLDKEYQIEYLNRVRLIQEYASKEAYPANFPMSSSHLRRFGKLSPFTPFYLNPVHKWPDVVREEEFITDDSRDVVKITLG